MTNDWDDFRFFATIARAGSVRGAAERLGVNASTVTRRLDALEARLGVMLFTRSQRGLQITPEGSLVIQRIDAVGDALEDIEAELKGRDQRLAGCVRLAVPDVLAVEFLLADLAPFLDEHPGIDLELIPGFQTLDLSRASVDVAIRATDHPPEDMVGRPLGRAALAAYGSKHYCAEHQVLVDLHGAAWIDWASEGEIMRFYAELRDRYFPDVAIKLSCDQVMMQHRAITAHMGLGILPTMVGDADETLLRLPHMPAQPGPGLWLLMHPDLRRVRRVQVLTSFLVEVFERRASALMGPMTSSDPGAARANELE